jgi:bifunctional DNA-binding transcriptional regulator/antitoxin component of YhaV-PrlF toxin-antitoxin module
MNSITVRIQRHGTITLPADLLGRYDLKQDDVLTLMDLGNGSFLLYPGISAVAQFGDQVARMMAEEDISMEEMLEALAQERERYYREHYEEA